MRTPSRGREYYLPTQSEKEMKILAITKLADPEKFRLALK
jgi:hypothetical protein